MRNFESLHLIEIECTDLEVATVGEEKRKGHRRRGRESGGHILPSTEAPGSLREALKHRQEQGLTTNPNLGGFR